MIILLLLIPLSLLLLVAAIWAFVWAVRRGLQNFQRAVDRKSVV